MCILNFTPHKISIYSEDSVIYRPEIRKCVVKPGTEPIESLASSGMLSAKITTQKSGELAGVPIYRKEIIDIDRLPEGNSMLVVSAIYAVAARERGIGSGRLLVISDPVFAEDGQTVVGCLGVSMAL